MMYEMRDLIIPERKLNIKKVTIFIVTILLCSFTIFISFYVSYKSMNKDNNIVVATNDKQHTTKNKEDNKQQATQQNKNNKGKDKASTATNLYTGNHIQIATHNMEIISSKIIEEAKAGFNPNAKEEIKNIYFSTEKQVYLTFDDGPSKDITPQILDILKQENVPATFFVLGSRAEVYTEMLKRIYNEGHYIANHGYSHKYSLIYERPENVFDEYIRTEQIIRDAIQAPEYKSFLFRFPGGSSAGKYAQIKKQAIELLEANQIANTNWNCLTGDAEGINGKDAQIKRFFETKAENQSLIVLMHDANDKAATVEVVRELIPYLKNEGYVFKNFYDIFRKE